MYKNVCGMVGVGWRSVEMLHYLKMFLILKKVISRHFNKKRELVFMVVIVGYT